MRNQWKVLRKWQKIDRNFYLFWGPKWPTNWTTEAHIIYTCERTCNDHVKEYWCKTSEDILRKWPKTWNVTNLGAQMAPNLALWGPFSKHRWKYLQWAVEVILMWNQWNLLRKWPKSRILTYFGVQNGLKIGSLGTILYTSLNVAQMSI